MDLHALLMQTLSLDKSSNRNEGVPDEILPILQQFSHVPANVWISTNLKEGVYSCSTQGSAVHYFLSFKKNVIDLAEG